MIFLWYPQSRFYIYFQNLKFWKILWLQNNFIFECWFSYIYSISRSSHKFKSRFLKLWQFASNDWKNQSLSSKKSYLGSVGDNIFLTFCGILWVGNSLSRSKILKKFKSVFNPFLEFWNAIPRFSAIQPFFTISCSWAVLSGRSSTESSKKCLVNINIKS